MRRKWCRKILVYAYSAATAAVTAAYILYYIESRVAAPHIDWGIAAPPV